MTNTKTPFPKYRKLLKEDGTKAISWNGKLHSWDGPALVTPNGKKEYYIYGMEYTKDDYKERKKALKGLPFSKDPTVKSK